MKSNQYKIGIVGLGPVGLILATHLKEAGQDVILCDISPDKLHLIRQDGVQLTGKFRKQVKFDHLTRGLDELAAKKPDLVFTSVKGYHLRNVVKEARNVGLVNARFISAQNGIDVEREIGREFGDENVLRMVINYAGNLKAPNVVQVNFFNPPNYIASVDDSQSTLAGEIAGWLNEVNLDTVHLDSFEILKRIWEKTILNASLSALCGIGQFTIKEAMDLPDTEEIIEQTIFEAVEVAKAEKIMFEPNFVRRCMRYLRKAGDHFPSLAVDLLNNQPTEIEYFNGKLVEYGKKHYVRTDLHLVFTNIVKALTRRNLRMGQVRPVLPSDSAGNGFSKMIPSCSGDKDDKHFLGVDLGSSYTKLAVINDKLEILFSGVLKSLNRQKKSLYEALDKINEGFNIESICATGYGRETFPGADLTKTEIQCAAKAIHNQVGEPCNVIDIGAEDIKVLQTRQGGQVANFFMNSKCAAGTGAFITEIAEKAEISLKEMSKLAALSGSAHEINSFCTVFAKTEVMKLVFDQKPIEDIAKGIYLSLANRIQKLRINPEYPVYLAGGVIAFHSYMKSILEEKLDTPVYVADKPQFTVAKGAAIYARRNFKLKNIKPRSGNFKKKKSKVTE